MTDQEQAFRAYYASMTDEELLSVAANKASFIDVAQKTMAAELMKRNLMAPSEVLPGESAQFQRPTLNVFSRLAKRLGGVFQR